MSHLVERSPVDPKTGRRMFEAVQAHMGTLVAIKLYADDKWEARAGFQVAFARIGELNGCLSDYQPESELNRVCRAAVNRPVPVSADLFCVLWAAQQLAVASEGAFDVTRGQVTHLWRRARREGRLPDPDALCKALSGSGFRNLHLDAKERSVQFCGPHLQLDLGALGKGFAADEAIAVLRQRGLNCALVAMSGDLACAGAPWGAKGWRIRLPVPSEIASVPLDLIRLRKGAVCTSGDDRQYLQVGSKRYSHILDARSGVPLSEAIKVTVIANQALVADGLATAISVLGLERSAALIESAPGNTVLVIVQQDGFTHVVKSGEGLCREGRLPIPSLINDPALLESTRLNHLDCQDRDDVQSVPVEAEDRA